MSDELFKEAATYTTHNKKKTQTFESSTEFQAVILPTEMPQTYVSNHMATRTNTPYISF
jgi:hypothetical protein